VHFISDDPELRRLLQESRDDRVPILPPIPMTKKPERELRLGEFDSSAIRAAVLVAVDPPENEKIRNEVTAKYCRDKAYLDERDAGKRDLSLQVHCMADGVLGREYWLAMYVGDDDGPDESLRKKVKTIASDAAVVHLAAQRSHDGEVGHPYIVLFGSRSSK
jgi:hypothetical protein